MYNTEFYVLKALPASIITEGTPAKLTIFFPEVVKNRRMNGYCRLANRPASGMKGKSEVIAISSTNTAAAFIVWSCRK
jgi:hypothetical protein